MKKFQDGDRFTKLYIAVFPEPRCFSEIHLYFCKEIRCSFDSGTDVEVKHMHFLFCPVTDRHTNTQTDRRTEDCCNPLPMLVLIFMDMNGHFLKIFN